VSNVVGFEVKIRQSRVRNIDTRRLLGRQGYILANLPTIHGDNGRTAFAMRMLELRQIEDALEDRPVPLVRKTLTANQRSTT
jgi:hypothetical protein